MAHSIALQAEMERRLEPDFFAPEEKLMNPECPKCEADSTRRIPRSKSLGHRFMHFFALYPWECLTCQNKFYSSARYSRRKRHALGEVYTESTHKPTVKPGSEEIHSK
jgi:hypothetical protein